MELKGKYVALALLLLTGIVGALFIYLGPRATAKSPGVLHVGIRYADEFTLSFARYDKSGPGARIEFIDTYGRTVYAFEPLRIGRNLVPIEPENLPSGTYTARVSAPGYSSVDLQVVVEGRMLNPAKGIPFPKGSHAAYNMIGARLEPVEATSTELAQEVVVSW
ncbi:hypothetical protein [Coraliomargarita parva]|uniref:hypothetical protein n=1 Tax=Coraliomargarita parva TaxID=3014050 RepID=UPI0022B416D8|nr:hypothetical protein [Coraliomargarita parva]